MKRAWLNLRYSPPDRIAAVVDGFSRLGYRIEHSLPTAVVRGDVMVTWNRIGTADYWARRYIADGCDVIVMENSSWGNEFISGGWLTVARNMHNLAGQFPIGGPERWDRFHVELEPWRTAGETVILPSRGLGPSEVAMPSGWDGRQKGRVRRHPGTRPCKPLREDLAKAGKVITWGSAAAVQARMWGIPVDSRLPGWIGECENTDESRLDCLRRLSWAQWQIQEIRDGSAFKHVLGIA